MLNYLLYGKHFTKKTFASSEHHQLPWRSRRKYWVRRYRQLRRPTRAMDAIIEFQGLWLFAVIIVTFVSHCSILWLSLKLKYTHRISFFLNHSLPHLMQQVSQNGLDIIGFLIDRLASDFKPYLNTVLTSIVDRLLWWVVIWFIVHLSHSRLGDTRESVREKANIALCKLMDATVTPQQLFEKLIPHFSHKNGKVQSWLSLSCFCEPNQIHG